MDNILDFKTYKRRKMLVETGLSDDVDVLYWERLGIKLDRFLGLLKGNTRLIKAFWCDMFCQRIGRGDVDDKLLRLISQKIDSDDVFFFFTGIGVGEKLGRESIIERCCFVVHKRQIYRIVDRKVENGCRFEFSFGDVNQYLCNREYLRQMWNSFYGL